MQSVLEKLPTRKSFCRSSETMLDKLILNTVVSFGSVLSAMTCLLSQLVQVGTLIIGHILQRVKLRFSAYTIKLAFLYLILARNTQKTNARRC